MTKKKILTGILQQIGISFIPPAFLIYGFQIWSLGGSKPLGTMIIGVGFVTLFALWAGQGFAIVRHKPYDTHAVVWTICYNLALFAILGIYFK